MSFPLRPLIEELVTRRAAAGDQTAANRPRVEIDIDPAHFVDAEPAITRRTLHLLVDAAFDAASCPTPPSDGPAVHEVVITSVQQADRLEIEIADSGANAPDALDITLAAARSQLARVGGALTVDGCPEGGRAVTVVLPRRAAQRMAA